MSNPRQVVADAVISIKPFDDLEAEHRQKSLDWAKSDAPLFRISKPDNPFQHLVSYFVLYDDAHREIMLIDHVKSGLWLPAGGHVDIDEDPKQTVTRELQEELRKDADFTTTFGDQPFFITQTNTIGQGNHLDVSLWYIVKGDSREDLWFDTREMNGYRWLSLDKVLATDITLLDPQLHRFINKMKQHLS